MRIKAMNRGSFTTMDDVPLIQVAGLYEDLESGIRAKVLIECVQASMDLSAQFKLDLWRFDWMKEEPLRTIALNAARNSALVIISISARFARRLPPAVENWMAAWSQDPGEHSSALIVLLPRQCDSRPRHPALLCERLQDAAQQKRANFFCEYFDLPMARKAKEIHRKQNPILQEITVWRGNPAERTRFVVPIGRSRTACDN